MQIIKTIKTINKDKAVHINLRKNNKTLYNLPHKKDKYSNKNNLMIRIYNSYICHV